MAPSGKQECVILWYVNCTKHDNKQVNTLHRHSTSVPLTYFKNLFKQLWLLSFASGPIMSDWFTPSMLVPQVSDNKVFSLGNLQRPILVTTPAEHHVHWMISIKYSVCNIAGMMIREQTTYSEWSKLPHRRNEQS